MPRSRLRPRLSLVTEGFRIPKLRDPLSDVVSVIIALEPGERVGYVHYWIIGSPRQTMYPFQPFLPTPPSSIYSPRPRLNHDPFTLLRFSSCNISPLLALEEGDWMLSDGPQAELRPAPSFLLSSPLVPSTPLRVIPWSFSGKRKFNRSRNGIRIDFYDLIDERRTVKRMELEIPGRGGFERGEMINGVSHLPEYSYGTRNGSWVDLINSTFLKISLRCYVDSPRCY